jgi:AraC-like DNA-binding protein
VTACLRSPGDGPQRRQEMRTFGTTTRELLRLADWLIAAGCTHVAMESTGVYWRPVYNLLEGSFELAVVNTQHVKSVPGRKKDVRDSAWLAQLLALGLLRGSFVPSAVQRELRDVVRYRKRLIEERAREANSVLKVLENDRNPLRRGSPEWTRYLRSGRGGWLGALRDPHIGKALQLIHERLDQPWTLRELGRCVGLGRSAFAARFTTLVGQPMNRYLIAHRRGEAASLIESSDDGIAEIAARVRYETASAFSKLFRRYHGASPGRFRTARRTTSHSQ